jgi:hypothetical protein
MFFVFPLVYLDLNKETGYKVNSYSIVPVCPFVWMRGAGVSHKNLSMRDRIMENSEEDFPQKRGIPWV